MLNPTDVFVEMIKIDIVTASINRNDDKSTCKQRLYPALCSGWFIGQCKQLYQVVVAV